jgi:NIMA (never in mitosis gene a)-related kinase
MDRKHKKYQKIKIISKQNNLDYTEYLVNYFPRKNNKENNKPIVCIDREIDIPKRFSKENMKDEEKKILYKKTKDHLEKEIKEISKLSHKGITKIIDYFEEPENVFHIISENYQCDLDDFIKMQKRKNKYFSESLVLSFFTQVCLAIKYIHDLNILHRNINPSNIILVSNKIVKISNFDLSRILYTSNEKSITLIKNSWESYISPEMGMNIPYSFKNDIWSLGILLFNMMALNCPFNNKQLFDIQNIKKVDKVYLYNKLPKHFSNDIKNLCIDLLKAYPAERPDINSVLNNYRIIKNEISKVEKILGGNLNKIDNIKNMYRTDLNFKQKIEAKTKSKNKNNRISSIYAQYLKRASSNAKNKDNTKKDNKKENEVLKLSVYENLNQKIMDPNNIMGRDMVYGQIINDRDSEDFSFNNNGINSNIFGSKEKLKEK